MPARSPEHQAIGAALRRLREREGVRIGALAENLMIDRGYLRGVERGERNASLELLLAYSSYFRVNLSEVILDAEAHPYGEDGRPDGWRPDEDSL